MIAMMTVLGILIGLSLAYLEARRKSKFRKKLLSEFESHTDRKAAERHMAVIVKGKTQWVKSISIIRKPFNKEINLAVETVALLLALMALISSIVNFNTNFTSMSQGMATLVFLSVIIGHIPGDWLFNGRVEKDIEGVMQELETAIEAGELKRYMAEAKKSWG